MHPLRIARPCAALCAALCFGAAAAQTAAPQPAERPEKRIEHIRIEDSGTVIEELRYGGETESITVQPKMKAPGYEVQPNEGLHGNSAARVPPPGSTGQRVWKVLTF